MSLYLDDTPASFIFYILSQYPTDFYTKILPASSLKCQKEDSEIANDRQDSWQIRTLSCRRRKNISGHSRKFLKYPLIYF